MLMYTSEHALLHALVLMCMYLVHTCRHTRDYADWWALQHTLYEMVQWNVCYSTVVNNLVIVEAVWCLFFGGLILQPAFSISH